MEDRPSIRLIGSRRMQCKDIPDAVFLNAVRSTPSIGSSNWRMRWDVRTQLESTLGHIPENLFLAKAQRLMGRGVLGGCPCGCRGDYHLPEECGDPLHCCSPAVSSDAS